MSELLDALRLFRSENVGPITYKNLIQRFGSPSEALKAIPDLATRGGAKRPIKLCSEKEATDEIKLHEKMGLHLLYEGSSDYPDHLKSIYDAPPVMSVKGQLETLSKPCIALVGSRHASLVGRKFAATLAQKLSEAGYITVSGMARGIDTSIHQATLSTGTIAVLAGGVDQIYPTENTALYHKIAEKGAVVAESPLKLEPQARLFPKRNRIISGLSLGVIVVEAALKSGSLITAQCALDQNREVFAVPGSPMDPRSNGTNSLIKQGATMVESADDVINALNNQKPLQIQETSNPFALGPTVQISDAQVAAARTQLTELLSFTPIELDVIMRHATVPPQALLTALLELELAGIVERSIGNRVSLISDVHDQVA